MASLGLRIGLPVVAVGLVTTSHDGNCASPDEARCPDCGEYGLVKMRVPPARPREAALLLREQPPPDFG